MKLNMQRLNTIATTVEAIEKVDNLITAINDNTSAVVVYATVKTPYTHEQVDVQFDPALIKAALEAQKDTWIRHLKERFPDFEYDPAADWHGDKAVDIAE